MTPFLCLVVKNMISIPVHEMTLQEKLEAIDLLWSSIDSETAEELSPAWHGKILEGRLEKLKAGSTHFEDWDTVKLQMQGWSGEG